MNAAFLADISQTLANLTNIDEIMRTVGAKICDFLKLSRCAFLEINETQDEAVVRHEWHQANVPGLFGIYRISEFVTGEFQKSSRAGEVFVVDDVQTDPRTDSKLYSQLEIGAAVSFPLIGNGEWRFSLAVYDARRRVWRDDEIELIRELTARIWMRLERARDESVLREAEERYRALVEATSTTVWHATPEGALSFVGDVWTQVSGQSVEEILKWGWLEAIHPDDRENTIAVWQNSLSKKTFYAAEFRILTVAGEYRWFAASAVPIFDKNGEVREWVGINIDVQDRKQAEADRRQVEQEREKLLISEKAARRQAEIANSLKDEFLATVSHELRTPLNAILGWSQMLKNRQLGAEETKNALNTIERSARAQNQLIEDLLDVSRIITGKLRLDVREVNLSNVITAAVDATRPAAEAKTVHLQTLIDPQAGPISGDPDRLQQVVWNLLSNAIKFTPKNGRVQVRLERVNSHVEIVVSDTGKGIETEFLPHVFDRFRQSDGSMTRRHGGLGLGLAIVRQLVELHGGTVSVISEGADQGSTFTVTLPLLPMRKESRGNISRVHSSAETGADFDRQPELADLRILLVDDEADSRELLNFVMDSCGAQVTTANSAAEALAAIEREKFDVVISDIGMPGEDGYSLIRKIRRLSNKQGGGVPAIALTAFARAEDRVQALRAGFQMHIAKPVDSNELIAVVANLAGRMRNPAA